MDEDNNVKWSAPQSFIKIPESLIKMPKKTQAFSSPSFWFWLWCKM